MSDDGSLREARITALERAVHDLQKELRFSMGYAPRPDADFLEYTPLAQTSLAAWTVMRLKARGIDTVEGLRKYCGDDWERALLQLGFAPADVPHIRQRIEAAKVAP